MNHDHTSILEGYFYNFLGILIFSLILPATRMAISGFGFYLLG